MAQDTTARNREHQRQSRARRKSYISDLEARIRKYEEEGVKTTIEVQAAARRVVAENAGLRYLLNVNGISASQIDQHLANWNSQWPSLQQSGRQAVVSHKHDGRRSAPSTQVELKPFAKSQQAPKNDVYAQRPSPENGARSSSSSVYTTSSRSDPNTVTPSPIQIDVQKVADPVAMLPSNTLSGCQVNDTCIPTSEIDGTKMRGLGKDGKSPCATSCVTIAEPPKRHMLGSGGFLAQPSSISITEGTDEGADEIDCEHAARIIASMRGHEDAELIMPELGCSTNRSCKIKNVTVFSMI